MLRRAVGAALVAWTAASSSWASSGPERFVCAGTVALVGPPAGVAGKPVAFSTEGTRSAIAVFATFGAEVQLQTVPPSWSSDLFVPSLPGSFSHFYDTMSFGKLQVRGEVASRKYFSLQSADHYLSPDPTLEGRYGLFCQEILDQADEDIDFARYDNDGPDGVPASGDDDGVVDALFMVVDRTPFGFILGPATGMGYLGLEEDYVTDDSGPGGSPIVVIARQGAIQQGRTYREAVGAMCHEFGHFLGLPDLYNTAHLRQTDPLPEEDSAGIGAWGLMGWGALGWHGDDGPNSFCAWSRSRLGWAEVLEPEGLGHTFELEDVGIAGQVYRIPLSSRGYFLLEYRSRASTYYDRAIPAEGLLIWHVERALFEGKLSPWSEVDLECADGRWGDAGYPLGRRPEAHSGGDNLDFWSHDEEYAAQHAGNLGDATDPFDGVAHVDFTPDTNPAAISLDGAHAIHLQGISIAGGRVTGSVRIPLPLVELRHVSSRSARVAAGNAVIITFDLANRGATDASGLRAVLTTEDEVLEILDPELDLWPLRGGESSRGANVSPEGFAHVRFPASLDGEHEARVELAVYARDVLLDRGSVTITGVPSHRVTGTVVDPDGQPVAGISVSVSDAGETREYFEKVARSDSAGWVEFHLPSGVYFFTANQLLAGQWGEVGYEGVSVGEAVELEFRLPRTYVLQGVVRHADGTPAVSARVKASPISDRDITARYDRSDGDGAYSMKLRGGKYAISVTPNASISQEKGTITIPADTVLDIALDPGVVLSLRVADEEGIGIGGVMILAEQVHGSGFVVAVTHSGEAARREVLPGLYEIEVTRVPAPYVLPEEPLSVAVLTDTAVTVVLEEGLTLAGRLVDEEGQTVQLRGSRSLSFVRDEDGRSFPTTLDAGPAEFSVSVLPGRYTCRVRPGSSGDLPSQELGIMEVRADTTINLLASGGVAVTGKIHGIRGGMGSFNFVQAQGIEDDRVDAGMLDAYGSAFLRLMPGEYAVRAYFLENGHGMLAPSQDLGTLHVARDTVIAWHLLEDEVVEGRVVDAQGGGVEGVSVSAEGKNDGKHVTNEAATRADGSFTIRLPHATYAFSVIGSMASGDEVYWYLRDLVVPPLGPVVYVLPGGASVTTRITDGLENAAEEAMVELRLGSFGLREYLDGEPAVVARLLAGSSHNFEVAPGRYTAVVSPLFAAAPVYGRVVEDLLVEGETELSAAMPLEEGEHRLAGGVTDADGSDDANGSVFLYETGLGLLVEVPLRDGSYETALPEGSYQVAVQLMSREGELNHEVGTVLVDADRTWDIDLASPTAIGTTTEATPHTFSLAQSYPNPFNADTTIRFWVPSAGEAVLTVHDLLGQRMRLLVREELEPGQHAARWDGRDDAGRPAASGVYLYRLQAGGHVAARKLLLLK